jgi:hypothetical protein
MLFSLRSGLGSADAAAALEELDDLLQAEGDDEADADGDEVNEHEAYLLSSATQALSNCWTSCLSVASWISTAALSRSSCV